METVGLLEFWWNHQIDMIRHDNMMRNAYTGMFYKTPRQQVVSCSQKSDEKTVYWELIGGKQLAVYIIPVGAPLDPEYNREHAALLIRNVPHDVQTLLCKTKPCHAQQTK